MTNALANRCRVVVGDITKLAVDAIVNAANESLRGGGGVDGAIHRAAGPGLLEECIRIGGSPPGEARLTGGHRLAARSVIHTVGPVYEGGTAGEADVLASCYRESLKLAVAHDIQSLAFPCISTGVYGYPKGEACAIAVDTVSAWLSAHPTPKEVTFCCFSTDDGELYETRLRRLGILLG